MGITFHHRPGSPSTQSLQLMGRCTFILKSGTLPDPYPNEKPLFTVTAQNMAQYGDKVTEGQREMLKKYPSYRLDVYVSASPPPRPSQSLPTISRRSELASRVCAICPA